MLVHLLHMQLVLSFTELCKILQMIKVTGQKWFWSFDYPEGVTTVNELVVPLNKPVKLVMSSRDVIHSFFVPDFRVKMDVLPNRYTVIWFEATQPGNHNIFCTEYCGKGHSDMLGTVKVVSVQEYAKWLEEGSTLGEGLTLEELGAKLYTARACHTCHKIDGSVSQDIGMDHHEKVAMNYALESGMEAHIKGGMKVIIEAGLELTLKAGISFIHIGPAGIDISGLPFVNINSGGSAGSGSGSSPVAPGTAQEASPTEPEMADDSTSGTTSCD